MVRAPIFTAGGKADGPCSGSTVYSRGEYHFVGSYMVNECALSSYGTNSAFLHASGPTPLGPFTFRDQILPPFHHGAQVGRMPDGSFYIVGDGENTPAWTWQTNCQNGNQVIKAALPQKGRRELRRKVPKSGLYAFGNSPQDFHIAAVSTSMYGPWTVYPNIMHTDLKPVSGWSCNVTNLSPLVLRNGTIIMSFRSRSCVPDSVQAATCGNLCQFIGLAVSQNGWAGPFIRQAHPIAALQGNEDPFFWQDDRGYHILMHGKVVCGGAGVGTCGSLGYSQDLVTWYLSPDPVYGATISLTSGADVTLNMRHRPKILFNSDMVPLVLYNGALVNGQSYIRNVAVAFNTAAMRNYQPPAPCPPKPQFKTLCGANEKGVPRNQAQCVALGTMNCIWCAATKLCMYGSDVRICTAEYPDNFYDYC